MSTRFVSIDCDTPMLLPPDLLDWVAAHDPVHLVREVIQQMPTAPFAVNQRGSELADRQRLREKVNESKERIEARAREHA